MPAYRDKDGHHWYAKFYYKDYAGVRHQKCKRGFATRHAALQYENDYINRDLRGSEEIFEHIYAHYMEDAGRRFKLSTMKNKRNIFEKKILPYFARMRMKDITPKCILEWQNRLTADPHHYSQTYLHAINCQLNALMQYAKKVYDLPDNPCERVDFIGSSDAGELQFWTPEEYKKFRDVLPESLAVICFEMLYWTGIRVGEMTALTAADIHLEDREIFINKTYRRLGGVDYVWSPKTESSVRRVMMPDFLIGELREYIRTMPEPDDQTRLFPVNDAWLFYRLKKYAPIAGVKRIRCHDLRHSAASLLINEGFDLLEVSRRLGHKRPSTTMNIYAHLFPTKQEALVNRLDEIARM